MFSAGVTWINIASQLKAYIALWELCGFNKFSNFHIRNTKFSSGFSIKFEDYSITRLWQSLGSWSQRVNLFLVEGIAQQSGRNYSIWENEVNKAQDEYQKVPEWVWSHKNEEIVTWQYFTTHSTRQAGSLVILRQLGVNHGNVLKAFHSHHYNSNRHETVRRHLPAHRLFPCCLGLLRVRLLHFWTRWAGTQWFLLTQC